MKNKQMLIEGWCDGVCEPVNPGGHAAWGALCKIDGKTAWSGSGYCGCGPEMSNKVAEYSGILALLREIRRRMEEDGLRGVVILRGDSKLWIMQLQGRWKVHGGLYVPFFRKAASVLDDVRRLCGSNVKFEWIPREENGECDVLSKAELRKRGAEFKIQPEPINTSINTPSSI